MESPEKITVELADWCEEAETLLKKTVSHVSTEELKAQVEAGAKLFRVMQEDLLIGFYVLRVDETADGSEGVLVAGAGRWGADLTALLMPHVEKQFIGCRRLRVHTSRPGLIKKLAAMGYEPQEFVMGKWL